MLQGITTCCTLQLKLKSFSGGYNWLAVSTYVYSNPNRASVSWHLHYSLVLFMMHYNTPWYICCYFSYVFSNMRFNFESTRSILENMGLKISLVSNFISFSSLFFNKRLRKVRHKNRPFIHWKTSLQYIKFLNSI